MSCKDHRWEYSKGRGFRRCVRCKCEEVLDFFEGRDWTPNIIPNIIPGTIWSDQKLINFVRKLIKS
jgi:hypothetical protein